MHLISNLISFISYSCIDFFMLTTDDHSHGKNTLGISPAK